MIQGEFNSRGELFFEIGLISAEGDIFPVMAGVHGLVSNG